MKPDKFLKVTKEWNMSEKRSGRGSLRNAKLVKLFDFCFVQKQNFL